MADVFAIDQHRLTTAGTGIQRQIQSDQQRLDSICVLRIHPALLHQPGHSAIHRTCIQIDKPQAFSESTGHGAFAGSGRTINGNEGLAGHHKNMVDQTR